MGEDSRWRHSPDIARTGGRAAKAMVITRTTTMMVVVMLTLTTEPSNTAITQGDRGGVGRGVGTPNLGESNL